MATDKNNNEEKRVHKVIKRADKTVVMTKEEASKGLNDFVKIIKNVKIKSFFPWGGGGGWKKKKKNKYK